jgi:hypothetical protein
MKKKSKEITRRDFLRGAAGLAAVGAAGGLACGRADLGPDHRPSPIETAKPETPTPSVEKEAPERAKSRVILIRDENALLPDGKPNGEVLRRMLDEAVVALTDTEDPVSAWKTFITPSDTVGIKSNVWRFLPTPRALEDGIRRRVIDAGVDAGRISVDDRRVLRDPIFRRASALVNVRPLRTHHWAGVGSLIKNYIMFTPEPSYWHGDSCADLGGVWELPMVKGKTRLNILVMLTPLFWSKGPHDFSRKYTWPYRGLLVGTDPVATDATGLRILEAHRLAAFGKQQPFNVPPKHIRVAGEKFGLGVSDPSGIELLKLGWSNGALI